MARYKISIKTKLTEVVEIDDSNFADLTPLERDEVLYDAMWDCGMIEWNYEKLDD